MGGKGLSRGLLKRRQIVLNIIRTMAKILKIPLDKRGRIYYNNHNMINAVTGNTLLIPSFREPPGGVRRYRFLSSWPLSSPPK